jgi:hypothetical protein
VATKAIGPPDGVLVTPGLNVITPVGDGGVPPQVQTVVSLGAGAAWVEAAGAIAAATAAVAAASNRALTSAPLS